MRLALKQALKGLNSGEVPVGAVIVKNGKVIAKGYNTRTKKKDPLGHAEIMAIKNASKRIKDFRLNECEIYVTVEPCILCLGAVLLARVKRLIYGCPNPAEGALSIYPNLKKKIKTGYKLIIKKHVLKDESAELMRGFFLKIRKR